MRVGGTELPSLFPSTSIEAFPGFGSSVFRTPCAIPRGRQIRSRSLPKLKAFVRAEAPRTPGVYAMLGHNRQVLYVGKAKNLRARLQSYFREQSRDPKAGRILGHTCTLVWEEAADEFAALLRELELIRRFRPRFNVLGQPGRRAYLYLCLGRGPAGSVHLTRHPTSKEAATYGPFSGRGYTQEAVRQLNHFFGLRDCPSKTAMSFADVGRLFDTGRAAQCLRYELGTCLGPCAGLCTSAAYGTAAKAAKAFLDGRCRTPILDTGRKMRDASDALRFEQAAMLRDRLALFEWLEDKLKFLRTARAKNSFVYPLLGADGRPHWYLIHTGEVQAVLPVPTDAASASASLNRLEAIFSDTLAMTEKLERCVDSVLIVTAWFRKRADEKLNLLSMRQAANFCRAMMEAEPANG